MWMLPNLDYFRVVLIYSQLFHFTLLWNMIITQIILLFLLLFLHIAHVVLNRKQIKVDTDGSILVHSIKQRQKEDMNIIEASQTNQNKESLLTEYQQHVDQSQSKSKQQSNNKVLRIAKSIIQVLFSICFYSFWVVLSLGLISFYGFGYFGQSNFVAILTCTLSFVIVFLPTLLWKLYCGKQTIKQKSMKDSPTQSSKHSVNSSALNQCVSYLQAIPKHQKIISVILLTIWMGITILAVITIKRICICSSNEYYGKAIQDDWILSTEWSRKNIDKIPKICEDGQLCHFYATLAEDSSTQVFLNAHTGLNIPQVTFILSNNEAKQYHQQTSQNPLIFDDSVMQQIGQRNVHSVLFSRLTPDTTYQLVIIQRKNNKTLKISNYKTLQGLNATQIKIAVGGDVGMTRNSSILSMKLAQFNPDVLFFGGDNAYDDAMRTCWYSWDNFYWIFEDLNMVLNRTVPMVLTVGNHDVGFDALSRVTLLKDFRNIPSYFLYNPQHSSRKNKIVSQNNSKSAIQVTQKYQTSQEVPQFDQRSTFHYHLVGNTVQINLDSGYVESYSNQVYFIDYLSLTYQYYYRFANYHNPIYPSCTDPNPDYNDAFVISNGTKYWTPRFDNFKFTAAFQHHTHHRKFTKKIRNNIVNSTIGVRYIGDGSWGVHQPQCQDWRATKKPQMFQHFDYGQPNHIWQITVKKGKQNSIINYTAINKEGNSLFSLTQQLPPVWDPYLAEQQVEVKQI